MKASNRKFPKRSELTAQQLSEREGIRREKLKKLMDAGKNPYAITHFNVSHESLEIFANFDALEGQTVHVAGRMVSKRVMGNQLCTPFDTAVSYKSMYAATIYEVTNLMRHLRTWI